MNRATFILFILILEFCISPLAFARIYDVYRSDFPRGAFCAAIGGACAADTTITNSFFQNPAVLAGGEPDWDFDGDIASNSNLEPGMSAQNNVSEKYAYGGIAFNTGIVGAGISALQQSDTVDGTLLVYDENGLPTNTSVTVKGSSTQLNFPFAIRVRPRLSIGAALTYFTHKTELNISGSSDAQGNDTSSRAYGVTLGVFWRPEETIHWGAWVRLPTTLYESVRFSASTQNTTLNYKEDLALYNPWLFAIGYANEQSKRLSFFTELDIIGASDNAYLLSYNTLSTASGDQTLIAKGRKVVVEPHMGLRMPISRPTKISAGTYYEASRWEGYSGRWHATGGVSVEFWNAIEVIGGVDVAKQFRQILFTIR